MKWIDYLKKSLKESLLKGIEEPINALDKMLIYKSRKFDDLISLQSRLKDLNNDRLRGVIRVDDYDIKLNTLRESLINLINGIERSDIEGVTDERNAAEEEVLETIYKMWKMEEHLVLRLLDEASKITTNEELLEFARSKFEEFSQGKPYGANYHYPIDFTLTVIGSSDGMFYFHPEPKQIGKVKTDRDHYLKILEMKSGTFIWVNDFRSEQFRELYAIPEPERGNPNWRTKSRLTKLYFREVPHLDRIITFEDHINLRSRLPHKDEK